jgi:hypothetical protein
MAARKRTPFQREEDLVQITRLYLQGRTQRDIAEVGANLTDLTYEKDG